MTALVRRNFAASLGVGIVWWMILLAREAAREGWRPDLLNLHSTALVYLLLLLVQALLGAVASIRRDLAVRWLVGIFGGLMLVILAALWMVALQRPGISCWNATNISLLLYLGLSHLAFAAFGAGNA